MNQEYLNSIENFFDDSINNLTQQYKELQQELDKIQQNEEKDEDDYRLEIFQNKTKINQQQSEISKLQQQIAEKKRNTLNTSLSNENVSNFGKYMNIINKYFGAQITLYPVNELSRIDVSWFNDFNFNNSIILFETDENKVFGIFMGWYFVVIEGERLTHIYGSTGNSLNIIIPQFNNNQYVNVNNGLFILNDSVILGDIENAVVMNYRGSIRKMLTDKPIDRNVRLPIKTFYFYQAQINQ